MSITEDDIAMDYRSEKLAHSRPDQRVWFEHLADKDMMYVRVTSFVADTAASQQKVWRDIRRELECLGGVGTFVLDARNNGGGDDINGMVDFIIRVKADENNRQLLGNIYVAVDRDDKNKSRRPLSLRDLCCRQTSQSKSFANCSAVGRLIAAPCYCCDDATT